MTLNYKQKLTLVLSFLLSISGSHLAAAQTNYDLSLQHEKLCLEIYNTSKLYLLQGKWDEAVDLLNYGLKINTREDRNKRSETMLKVQLGNIFRLQRRFDLAMSVLIEARKIAESIDDKRLLSDCIFSIGFVFDHKQLFESDGDYNTAKEYYEEALKLSEGIDYQEGIGFAAFRIGRLIEIQGDDDGAMPYYNRVVEILETHGIKVLGEYVYDHLGFIIERKGDLDKALQYYRRVRSIQDEIGFKGNMPLSFMHIGRIYYKKGDIQEALKNYWYSINAAYEIGVLRSLPWSYFVIGDLYFEEAADDSALKYFDKTSSAAEELNIKDESYYSSFINKGIIYYNRGEFEKSVEILEKSLDLIKKNNISELLRKNYVYLSLAQAGLGNYRKALEISLLNIKGILEKGTDDYYDMSLFTAAVIISHEREFEPQTKSLLKDLSALTKLPQIPEAYFKEAIKSAKETKDISTEVFALFEFGVYLISSGNKNEGMNRINEAGIIAEKMNLKNELKKIRQYYGSIKINLKALALEIAGDKGDVEERTRKLVSWMNNNFSWSYTDYQKRTVEEIIKNRAGNCAEQARVLSKLLNELDIKVRWMAEINIHPKSERRRKSAENLINTKGKNYSVFGYMHNDHRWLEIYNDKNNLWFPTDPSIGIVGYNEWMEARMQFGERPVIAKNTIAQQMKVPFAVIVRENGKSLEDRSEHYLINRFNMFYNNKLEKIPEWEEWTSLIKDISGKAAAAFDGNANLHEYTNLIEKILNIYQKMESCLNK